MGGRRELKRKVLAKLTEVDAATAASELGHLPPRKVLSILLAHLNHPSMLIAGKAAEVLGLLVADWTKDGTDESMNQAREVMRRLAWSLNEESGSIGWGAPRAMAEIMTHQPVIGEEYIYILVSYLAEGDNQLEHEPLQRAVLWGLDRLARTRPELLKDRNLSAVVAGYLDSPDPEVRGLAAGLLGRLGASQTAEAIGRLAGDESELMIYRQGVMEHTSVSQMARRSLQLLAGGSSSV